MVNKWRGRKKIPKVLLFFQQWQIDGKLSADECNQTRITATTATHKMEKRKKKELNWKRFLQVNRSA